MKAKNTRRVGDLRVNAEIVMFGTDYGVPLMNAGSIIPVFNMTKEPSVDKRYSQKGVLA